MNSGKVNTAYLNSVLVNTVQVLSTGVVGKKRLAIPKPIKDAMVCWYDPRKQQLTNEDVVTKYKENFTNWTYLSANGTATIKNSTITITEIKKINDSLVSNFTQRTVADFKVIIKGDVSNIKYFYTNNEGKYSTLRFDKEGFYNIPKSFETSTNRYTGFQGYVVGSCNITITQLPTSILQDFSGNDRIGYCYNFAGNDSSGIGLYNRLVFDGVDDYVYCPNQPILTDYTVIAARNWFATYKESVFASKSVVGGKGAFITDYFFTQKSVGVYSYGVLNKVTNVATDTICQTSTTYNGKPIVRGTGIDYDKMYIGAIRIPDNRYYTGSLSSFLLFNRTLTTDEIEWVKNNLIK